MKQKIVCCHFVCLSVYCLSNLSGEWNLSKSISIQHFISIMYHSIHSLWMNGRVIKETFFSTVESLYSFVGFWRCKETCEWRKSFCSFWNRKCQSSSSESGGGTSGAWENVSSFRKTGLDLSFCHNVKCILFIINYFLSNFNTYVLNLWYMELLVNKNFFMFYFVLYWGRSRVVCMM